MNIKAFFHRLFPPNHIHVNNITESDSGFVIHASSVQRSALCPHCHHRSCSIQSSYTRTLTDLPLSGMSVRIHINTRRYFCKQKSCPHKIFSQPLDPLAKFYSRVTQRQNEQVSNIARFLGGRPTARASALLGVATTRTTALRRLRAIPLPEPPPTHVIGIDDFAFRKGNNYGTIIVDQQTHRPIDLLPDREAATVASWLEEQPAIEIVSRDRSAAYASGISQGAPNAVQVADRFHLIVNTVDALLRVLETRRRFILEVATDCAPQQSVNILEDATHSQAEPSTTHASNDCEELSKAQLAVLERRAWRLQKYEEVMRLHKRGFGIKSIARMMNLARGTVRAWIKNDGFPERAPGIRRQSMMDSWKNQVQAILSQGVASAVDLWRQLRKQGFHGSYTLIKRYFQRSPMKKQTTMKPDIPTTLPRSWRSPRAISWYFLGDQQKLQTSDFYFLQQLRSRDTSLALSVDLALRFMDLVRNQGHHELKNWIDQAKSSELSSFAQTIERDFECVSNAMSEPWSQGPVEGNVNRLKMIKRQMYGRANFDLLRRRVLLRA